MAASVSAFVQPVGAVKSHVGLPELELDDDELLEDELLDPLEELPDEDVPEADEADVAPLVETSPPAPPPPSSSPSIWLPLAHATSTAPTHKSRRAFEDRTPAIVRSGAQPAMGPCIGERDPAHRRRHATTAPRDASLRAEPHSRWDFRRR